MRNLIHAIKSRDVTWGKILFGYIWTIIVLAAFVGCQIIDYDKRLQRLENIITDDSVTVKRDTIDQGGETLIIDTHIRRKKNQN